jgi:acetyltransferase
LFDGSHRAVRAIGGYFEFIRSRDRLRLEEAAGGHVTVRSDQPGRILDYWDSRVVLESSGITFNQARAATDVDAAVIAANSVGFPVTLKVSSNSAVHKAAAGGVRLFVPDVASLRCEVTQMLDAFPDAKVVVERFTPGAAMALVGGHCDPEFGPVVVFGLGGGYAEAYRDVVHLQCPAGRAQVVAALASTKFGTMLRPESESFAAIVNTVVDASQWFARATDIRSFDVNPILIGLDGHPVAVDARVEIVDC